MDESNDHIGPYNGHNFRGPDIIVNGCLGIVGVFFFIIMICAAYGFYMGEITWWK